MKMPPQHFLVHDVCKTDLVVLPMTVLWPLLRVQLSEFSEHVGKKI